MTPGICNCMWMGVWYARWDEFHPTLHTRQSSTYSYKYQVSYWYSYFSWWWAHSCPKHVENRNKHTKKELCTRLVLFTRLYTDARSTKHNKSDISYYQYVRHLRLGDLEKLLKASISVFIPVFQSVRMEQIDFHWRSFRETWYLKNFQKYVEKIQVSLKSYKNRRCRIWRYTHIYENIWQNLFLEWETFQTEVVQKNKRISIILFIVLPCILIHHQSLSFTNRCTIYYSCKTLKFTLKLKLKLLLHVSVYDHHQGVYTSAWLKLHLC
jgi:hypothetical protein